MKNEKALRVKRQPTNNMKRFSEQLHKESQTVKLKKSEQAELRARLVSYMEYHPLPASMKTQTISNTPVRKPILTDSFAQYMIPYQSLFKFGGVAAVFVLLLVPFMAERTVPGDTLYAVKVQFNEEVRSTLTLGSYEKVEWETTRLNRRIAEARLLADEGLLTPEAEAEVAAAVRAHSDNAKREIEVLRATDADEATIATITFDSSLQVQAQALQGIDTNLVEGNGEDAQAVNLISDVIGASLLNVPDTEAVTVPAYDKLMARVEINTTRVRELRDTLTGSVSDQALVDVSRRIEDIDRAITEAIALADTPDTELAARTALVDVLTRTQKLIVFMTDLEVRETVTIESVVPVVLTADEVIIARSERTTRLTAAIEQLTTELDTVTDQDVQTKVEDALVRLETAAVQLSEIESYPEFVVQSDQALALAADALLIVGVDGTLAPQNVDQNIPDVATTTATATADSVATATSTESNQIEGAPTEPATSTATSTEVEIDTP